MMFNLIGNYCWPNILSIRKCKKIISNPNYYCCHKTLHFSPSPSQIRAQQLKNFMRQKLTKIGSLELKKKMFTCHNGTYCLILLYYILQLSLSIFTQKYLRKCKDTYFILQNKFLRIYEDIFGAKIIRFEDIIFSYRPSTSAGDLSSTNKIKEEEEKLYYNNTFWHLCILVCARGL